MRLYGAPLLFKPNQCLYFEKKQKKHIETIFCIHNSKHYVNTKRCYCSLIILCLCNNYLVAPEKFITNWCFLFHFLFFSALVPGFICTLASFLPLVDKPFTNHFNLKLIWTQKQICSDTLFVSLSAVLQSNSHILGEEEMSSGYCCPTIVCTCFLLSRMMTSSSKHQRSRFLPIFTTCQLKKAILNLTLTCWGSVFCDAPHPYWSHETTRQW